MVIKKAIANKIGVYAYGLVEGKEYTLEKSDIGYGMWLVYDNDQYVTAARTDCFDNYRDNL